MKKLSGGQAAVASLQAEKVEQIFGLIGSATMEMFDVLYDASDINFIGVHDERTGTHMADGYARAAARQLCHELDKLEARAEVENWTRTYIDERQSYLQEYDAKAETKAHPIQPSELYKELRDVLPKNAPITMDAGTLCLQATDALNYWELAGLFTPLDFGLVGFSIACGRPAVVDIAVDPAALYSFRRDSFKHRGG